MALQGLRVHAEPETLNPNLGFGVSQNQRPFAGSPYNKDQVDSRAPVYGSQRLLGAARFRG